MARMSHLACRAIPAGTHAICPDHSPPARCTQTFCTPQLARLGHWWHQHPTFLFRRSCMWRMLERPQLAEGKLWLLISSIPPATAQEEWRWHKADRKRGHWPLVAQRPAASLPNASTTRCLAMLRSCGDLIMHWSFIAFSLREKMVISLDKLWGCF